MASRRELAEPKGFDFNGLLPNESISSDRPHHYDRWVKAEKRTAELISCIQPSSQSEKHRRAVALYVQCLIQERVPCQVSIFGSVPLRTYLPDGDIDVTVLCGDPNLKDVWANEVLDVLKGEEKNKHAKFEVKDVQFIQAEVKIIKCLVDNIVVDISFNQFGGLCTLCFLEEVNYTISQNHLFKRSILLIKAWCYYESRILGAHHGLISTYSLETLVLYIFHVYNHSFAGPLEVLYCFLEFFSKFDWANFCVSLSGPVPMNKLSSMSAESPRKDGEELLLDKMFLRACRAAYAVVPVGAENLEQPFISKFFNVIDPLRSNNNLGRSVSKGNFYRIRSAFNLGAQELDRILDCPEEDVEAAVNQFFVNTWGRHGKGCRPDAPTLDASHFSQSDSNHGKNLRKDTSIEKPTKNRVNRDPVIDPSHPSFDLSLQAGNLPPNHASDVFPNLQENYNDLRIPVGSDWDRLHYKETIFSTQLQNYGPGTLSTNISQDKGNFMHYIARTYSSPELTNMSHGAAPSVEPNVAKDRVDHTCSMSNCIGKTVDTTNNHVTNYSPADSSLGESSSSHDVRADLNPIRSTGGYVGDFATGPVHPAFYAGYEPSQGNRVQQDFTNLMSSSGFSNYVGLVRMPVNVAPPHPLVLKSASTLGYSDQNCLGTVAGNASLLMSDWGTDRHSYDSHISSSPLHCVTAGVASTDLNGGLNNCTASETTHHDGDCGNWNAASITENGFTSDDFSTASSRLSPSSFATSSRTKASSESSWDGKPSKMTPSRNHLGKKTYSRYGSIATVNSDGVPYDHTSDDGDDSDDDNDCNDRVLLTPKSLAPSVTSSQVEVHPKPTHPGYPSSVLPFGPIFVHPGSHPAVTHNHAVFPVAIYPAGLPFVTMVPLCNLPTETGKADAQDDGEIEQTSFPPSPSYSSDSTKDAEHHNIGPRTSSVEYSCEDRSDIFNGDYSSHWRNLQYGRLCQSSELQHPLVYSPSVLIPTPNVQGHLPSGILGKPAFKAPNPSTYHVPNSVPQTGSSKAAGMSQKYAGEVPKHRNGTGTYFPNPVLRDQQYSSSRQYRADNNYDKNEDHGNRDARLNFTSKPRFGGRSQARYQVQRSDTKIDRSSGRGVRNDKSSNAFRRNSNHSWHLSNHLSQPMDNGCANFENSMYLSRSAYLNDVSPSGDAVPLVMVYPYPQNSFYGSETEKLQFRSTEGEHFIGMDDVAQFRGYSKRGHGERRSYQ